MLQDNSNEIECLGTRQQVEEREREKDTMQGKEHRAERGRYRHRHQAPINMEMASSSQSLHGRLTAWQKEKRLQLRLFGVRGQSARSDEKAPGGEKKKKRKERDILRRGSSALLWVKDSSVSSQSLIDAPNTHRGLLYRDGGGGRCCRLMKF